MGVLTVQSSRYQKIPQLFQETFVAKPEYKVFVLIARSLQFVHTKKTF